MITIYFAFVAVEEAHGYGVVSNGSCNELTEHLRRGDMENAFDVRDDARLAAR